MTDRFSDGTQSIVSVLRPRGSDWQEIPIPTESPVFKMGYPARAYIHKSGLAVISAVEAVSDQPKGFEYHISISQQKTGTPQRCTSNEAKWVMHQFGLDGWEEDNHVSYGKVRNFWRPVAEPLVGMECKCKEDEPEIRENKGDFVWRPTA